MKKVLMLLATFLTGLLLSGQCYALQFSPYSNATESARIEIIRENITQLDESHLTWLGGEVSNIHWNHWFTKAQRHRNADYQYKVRVSLFNINATKGNIKFGGKEVPLNIEPSEDYETYYPKYFYDIDNLIEKFSATTVTLNVDNATNSTEIPTLDETDFPDKANVDIDFENKTLTASNIPKQASWAYAETWETKNDEYNFLNQKFEMLNSTVPFNFDYSKASYNASKKYFYHFSTGWANENGISYRTYQWGLLKDNTNINMFNNQLDATYHGQKYGLAGENAIYSGINTITFHGNGIYDWKVDDNNFNNTSSNSSMYYATDNGLLSLMSWRKGAIAHNGQYGANIATQKDWDRVNINFINKHSTDKDESSLQGEYRVYGVDHDDTFSTINEKFLTFDGSGFVKVENATNANYTVQSDGSVELTQEFSNSDFLLKGHVSPNNQVLSLNSLIDDDESFLIALKRRSPDEIDENEFRGHYYGFSFGYDTEYWSAFFRADVYPQNSTISVKNLKHTNPSAIGNTHTFEYATNSINGTVTMDVPGNDTVEGAFADNGNIFVGTSKDEMVIFIRSNSIASDADNNGIDDSQEVPESINDVDLDGDGKDDRSSSNTTKCLQHTVKTTNNATQEVITTVKTNNPSQSINKIVGSSGEDEMSDKTGTVPSNLPHGLYNFKVDVAKGDTATISFHFNSSLETDSWYKYTSSWQELPSENYEYKNNATEVELTIQDGGFADADGLENGVIHDPSGPGTSTTSETTSSSGGGCLYSPAASGGWSWMLLLLVPAFTCLVSRNRRTKT